MSFHASFNRYLSNSKFFCFPRLFSIFHPANLNSALIWAVSILPQTPNSTYLFSGECSYGSNLIAIPVTFMYYDFFSSDLGSLKSSADIQFN